MIGLIGIKEGMSQVFNESGDIVPVTVVKIDENIIMKKRIQEKEGYNALLLGSINIKEKKINKPGKGQFKDIPYKRYLKEFRIDDPNKYELGQKVGVEIFEGVEYVDVIGISKGKGFQGVKKRHNFGGGPRAHGSKFQRQNGATGDYKGLKRAGRMGNERVTAQNLKICEIDKENNLILLRGSVPGKNKGILYIKKSIKSK